MSGPYRAAANGAAKRENGAKPAIPASKASSSGKGAGAKEMPAAKPPAPPAINERLLFCANVLVGYKVEVQVRRRGAAQRGPAGPDRGLGPAPCRGRGRAGAGPRAAWRAGAAAITSHARSAHAR
jgi:hypothetical protein